MSTNNKTINDLPIYEDERLASLQLQANQVTTVFFNLDRFRIILKIF